MVDDQFEPYTSELLLQLKLIMKKSVKEKLTLTTEIKALRFRKIKDNVRSHLIRLISGKFILNLVHGGCVFSFDHDNIQ